MNIEEFLLLVQKVDVKKVNEYLIHLLESGESQEPAVAFPRLKT